MKTQQPISIFSCLLIELRAVLVLLIAICNAIAPQLPSAAIHSFQSQIMNEKQADMTTLASTLVNHNNNVVARRANKITRTLALHTSIE
uniref:Putative secreted protein n=1 Tax=Anopheles marajoara TaxID=58244 RepID=A0A2M4CAM5_9DIPT